MLNLILFYPPESLYHRSASLYLSYMLKLTCYMQKTAPGKFLSSVLKASTCSIRTKGILL